MDDALEEQKGQGPVDVQLLASWLSRQGYKIHVRTALGGGSGQDCLRNLRHTFLTCHLPGKPSKMLISGHSTALPFPHVIRSNFTGTSYGSAKYVVDPYFKEQFEVSN